MEYGIINIKLEEKLKERGISRYRFCIMAELQRTQLNKYYFNRVSKVDINVLARMCEALQCGVGDLIEFIPLEDVQE